jgi:hypothetical protein
MSDQKESAFPGFAGFQPVGLFDKMWDMMRLTPFFGASGTGGLPPSLSSMSDMMAPLSSVEELDKRITDLRAVEQWLKLNLGMLQSAIQALEVQRATLATLRAFGAFAKTSMEAAASDAAAPREPAAAKPWPFADLTPAAPKAAAQPASPEPEPEPPAPEAAAPAGASTASGSSAPDAKAAEQAAADAGFDPASWWNLLQSQFNQLAGFAMNQSAAMAEAAGAAQPQAEAGAAPARKPAAKRSAAAKATSSGARSKSEAAPNAAAAPRAASGAKPAARKTTTKRPG